MSLGCQRLLGSSVSVVLGGDHGHELHPPADDEPKPLVETDGIAVPGRDPQKRRLAALSDVLGLRWDADIAQAVRSTILPNLEPAVKWS